MSLESQVANNEQPATSGEQAENGSRQFASNVPHDNPGRKLYWADNGKRGIETPWWYPKSGNYAEVHKRYFIPDREQQQKDGLALFPGKLSGDRCIKENVEHVDLAIADVDAIETAEVKRVVKAIKQAGLGCDCFNGHKEVKRSAWDAFCNERG